MSDADKLLIAIGVAEKTNVKNFYKSFIGLFREQINIGFGEESDEESDEIYYMWAVLRLLDSLGYCEFDFDRREIFPCPPAIVLLPGGGLKRSILTGICSHSIMEKIKDYESKHKKTITVISETQEAGIYSYRKDRCLYFTFPTTIVFEYFDEDSIVGLASEIKVPCNVKFPASWALAEYSIGLKEYRENNFWDRTREDEVNWKKRYFNPDKFEFTMLLQDRKDVYQLTEYEDPVTKQKEHWLWKNDTASLVNREWGKYDILSHISKDVFLYDPQHQTLAVPLHLYLPRLLSRAVVMCSGKIPICTKTGDKRRGGVPENTLVSVYCGVPPEYALKISSKLLQKLVKCTIEIGESGVKIL